MLNKGQVLQPTVKDVAKLANVSPATVSRVFDDKWDGKIKPETREKVLTASKRLGYTPNAIARSLLTNQTNIVAVVIGVQIGFFYSETFFQLIQQIQSLGRQVLVFSANPKEDVNIILTRIHQYRVDAILIFANATSNYMENYFVNCGIPVILFDRVSYSDKISYISSDNEQGAQIAANYLIDNGHKDIAYISGDYHSTQSVIRSDSFMAQVKARGGHVVKKIDSDFTYRNAYAAMQELMDSVQFDSVFCADDTTAMAVMDAARARGMRIPEDFSVMGFDNHSISELPVYDITTVTHNFTALFQSVIDVLENLSEAPTCVTRKLCEMSLVERGSVRLK